MKITAKERKAVTTDMALDAAFGLVMFIIGIIFVLIDIIQIIKGSSTISIISLSIPALIISIYGGNKFFSNYALWKKNQR